MTDRIIGTDVLVVGGGGAGFRAAIGAREKGANCILLSKGPLGRCGATPLAGADFTLDGKSLNELGFPGDPNDTKEKFFSDIVHQGFYLNNQKLVEQYINGAQDRLRELLDWGIKTLLSEERAIITSGPGIMDALVRKARQVGVETMDDIMVTDLLSERENVTGALALDVRKGDFIQFKSKAVVIATGGWHKGFWPNTGMRDLSGEGIAASYRAGAQLGNLEFITFISHTLLSPPIWRGSIIVYVLSLVAGGELYNSDGERFLSGYDPYVVEKGTTMEWNKGFLSHAMSKEVRRGKGSPNGGVFYGTGDIPWDIFEKKSLKVFPGWKSKAADFTELAAMLKRGQPVEVGPAVEYFDGGIVINDKFETNLKGLFAAGECTLGLFGANRIASAIAEMLIHGASAGWNAAEYAKTAPQVEENQAQIKMLKEKAFKPLMRGKGIRAVDIRRRIQTEAHRCLGPIRNQGQLEGFITLLNTAIDEDLPRLYVSSSTRTYNKEWIDALELENILTLLHLSAMSALSRTESRGVHFREDHPQTDNDRWLVESILSNQNGKPKISHRPVTVTSMTPPGGVTPYLEMLKKMMEAHSDVGGHH